MSDYIVSARKYRPEGFETLIGQDVIAQTLKNSISRGKIAHAYLFCGPRGVGKTSTARIFAKAINCSNPGENLEPCGCCESCVSFQEGRSYCIHELDAASNNGVDDIKALLDKVQIPPQVGRYSVYIIDEVHMLSTQAFNAFLKTLEEPPAHAIFILATTEKHKILPTILSRCQTYDFNRISVPDIVMNLRNIAAKEGIRAEQEALHVIAKKADGAMRDALTIFDQMVAFCGNEITYGEVLKNLNVLDYECTFSLVDNFLAKDYASALKAFDEILAKGFNSLYFVESLSSHLRDLMVSKASGLDSLLDLPESFKARYKEQADRCTTQFLYDALNITMQCEAGYKSAVNQRLHIEFALMKLSFLQGVPQQTVSDAKPAHQESEPAMPEAKPAFQETKQALADNKPASQDSKQVVPEAESGAARDASQAAPESEPEAATAPHPARKRGTSPASLSLTAILDEENNAKEVVKEQSSTGELPSDEVIFDRWKELSAMNASRPRLASALANAKLSVVEEGGKKTVTFTVTNDAQKKWIEDNLLRDLEGSFQKIVESSSVNLSVEAAQYVEEVVKYLPEEKAKDLMERNVEVKNLVIDLGLDL